MKNSWAKPSLSRDFALLSAAVLCLLLLISGWVTYTTYVRHSESVTRQLENESGRTERALSVRMEMADYLLNALGKQIVLDSDRNLTRLAQVLKSFDDKNNVYTLFSWVNPHQQLVVSSSKGILDTPIDVSDRDYVKQALAEPWKMAIGNPLEGRASERWIIPVAMGLTDYTGKFIGIIMISIDINKLTQQVSDAARRDGINFVIASKSLVPLTEVQEDKDFMTQHFPPEKWINIDFSTHPQGLMTQGSPFWGSGSYGYYRVSQEYPYVVLLGYETHYGNEAMRGQLWSRLLQMLVMAGFFVALLWIIRARMIRPILDMTTIAAGVARGELCAPMAAGGPVEMEGLATQIRHISEYIEENKRARDELRNKMFMFKKAKEEAELSQRSKSEFMAYICQELRVSINAIIGAAQVMKDQLYGPIENRKYRQYAADIYTTGNLLLDKAQDVLLQAKAETDYIALDEKPVDVEAAVNRALRFLADKMQVENLAVKVRHHQPSPMLMADDFRLQQIIMNLLSYALAQQPAQEITLLETRIVNENKDKAFFAITISAPDAAPQEAVLHELAERWLGAPHISKSGQLETAPDLHLELAKALIALHQGVLHASHDAKGRLTLTVLLHGNRIRFVEG